MYDDSKKKKSIALKASTSYENNESNRNNNEEKESDLVLIAKKFKKILARRSHLQKRVLRMRRKIKAKVNQLYAMNAISQGCIKYDCLTLKRS